MGSQRAKPVLPTGQRPRLRPMGKLGAGITNKQAAYLAALCRELNEPYIGSGMSRLEASQAIRAARERVGDRIDRRRAAMAPQGPQAPS